jgi:hypothetical protein
MSPQLDGLLRELVKALTELAKAATERIKQ